MDDNLESLDNTTLREKCIQYGLPNVPVTDSSRKVLIKRLRMSMGGGGGEKVAKAREATPKKVLNTAPKVTPKKSQSRRTIAEAPLSKPEEKTSFAPRPAAEKKVNNVLLFSDFSNQQEEDRPFQRAPSLTPSEKLAKSGVFTTSYSQETTVLEDEYEDDPYTSSSARSTILPLSSYQTGHGLAHPIGGFFKNTENQSTLTKTDRNMPRSPPAINVPSYGITSATNYIGPERTYPRNTFSSLSQQKSDIIKPSLTRRYTEYTTVKDSGDDDDVEEVQTPYLSSFARSLERLKSGEVATLTPSAPIRKKTSLYGSRQGYGYNDTGPADDSVSGALRQFLIALEHKYQLKRAFAFFLVFVLVVFIYVFFVM